MVSARSISEEFSSGDTGRYRDEEYLIPHGASRDRDKQNRERDERDEGQLKQKLIIFISGFVHHQC